MVTASASTVTTPHVTMIFAGRSRRPVGNARISTYVARPNTFSQSSPAVNSQLLVADWKT
jgi:hypothetical protein